MATVSNDYAKIVAKAWADEHYRNRLVNDTSKVLAEEGWTIDPSTTVQIKPDSDTHTLVLGLPKKPEGLSDDQLRDAADGVPCSSRCANPCSC